MLYGTHVKHGLEPLHMQYAENRKKIHDQSFIVPKIEQGRQPLSLPPALIRREAYVISIFYSWRGYGAHRFSTVVIVSELVAPWNRVDVSESSQRYSGVCCHLRWFSGVFWLVYEYCVQRTIFSYLLQQNAFDNDWSVNIVLKSGSEMRDRRYLTKQFTFEC